MSTTLSPVAVFDLDGTLVDTLPDLAASLNVALEKEGLARVSQEDARRGVGHGARRMIEHALADRGVTPDRERIDRMHGAFLEHYTANIAVDSVPFPGAVAAMDALSARGIVLAVCTNKYEALARRLLGDLGLADRFAAIAGGDTFPASKPNPQHLTGTIQAAKCGAAVMIGDSDADIGAAKAAGIPSVAVSFGYSTRPAAELGADRLIAHFDELEDAVVALLDNGAGGSANA
ncbi:HAD family hydrolase [Tepidamorphus sp. 3E244]|uniref:HAD family hydrolase n=1 Tax=Tepidamorphus sp. 3E244 TaxID=3385498 RepID=UPI0038FCFA0B